MKRRGIDYIIGKSADIPSNRPLSELQGFFLPRRFEQENIKKVRIFLITEREGIIAAIAPVERLIVSKDNP
ncbi:MAG: hypothetical protein M1510_03895 [Nitrospirae bacterium]|nr:hypothetical protein [Nitrospirota bacterium]